MWRLFLVVALAGVLALQPDAAHGQSDPYEQFKADLASGDHFSALELITSVSDTASKLSDHLASKVRSVADRIFNDDSQGCAEDLLYAIHTKALISYASDANVVFRMQQDLNTRILAYYGTMDAACRARAQKMVLEQMHALPSYVGILGVSYMELFSQMPDEEVVSFLSESIWVRPILSKHMQLIESGSPISIGPYFLESMAVVAAMSYARLHNQHEYPEIPDQVEYASVALNLAQQAMRSTNKETRRYASLLALSYALLLSEEEVAETIVSEENISEHLSLIIDIVDHWRAIDLPKPLRGLVEQLTPVYYTAFVHVYSTLHEPENARSGFLHGAELIAIDQAVILATLGPCKLARVVAEVRAHSLSYTFEVEEGSKQLLDLFFRSDSISVACAYDLANDTYTDSWKDFQYCFSYCAALGEYQASAEMMAIAAETLVKEEYEDTRSVWMDYMLATFDESIRHDTIVNSTSASRHMFDFVRYFVHGKADPYTDQQALFVLLHLARIEEMLAQPVHGRCSLIERVLNDVVKFGSSDGVTKLAELLFVECNGQDAAVLQAALDYVDSDYGKVFLGARIFASSIPFARGHYPKGRDAYMHYIELNRARYGPCSRYSVSSVGTAILYYNVNHRPAEVKQFLDDMYAKYYQPKCQELISWLPAFMAVKGSLSNDLALKAILQVNMQDLFKGLRTEDCISLDEKTAFVSWKNSSYTNFIEAEANAREALAVLYALHGGDEQAWFNETTPYIRKEYRTALLLTYSTLCGAFNGFGNVRPDSLCRYALLLEDLLRKEPALSNEFAVHVQERLDECEAVRGVTASRYTCLLPDDDLIAMDKDQFADYIAWYGQQFQDSVSSICLRWAGSDRVILLREIRPFFEHHRFMLALAREKSSLSGYCALLVQLASCTPSTVHKDHILSVLGSIYERYPEQGVSVWNRLARMHTITAMNIIIHDRYQKYVSLDYPYFELIDLSNNIVYSDLWTSLDDIGRSLICKELLEVLAGYDLKTENDARAWQFLARVGALFILEEGSDAQVHEMQVLMNVRLKSLTDIGHFDERSIEGREFQMFIELLKARRKPQMLTPSFERTLLDLMKEDGGEIDMANFLRGYTAVLRYNPETVENADILTQGLEWLSIRFWSDFLYMKEQFKSRYIEENLYGFWKVVRSAIMQRDTHRLPHLFTTTWVETLWLQTQLIGADDAISELEAIGFDEDLLRKLQTIYWSHPDTAQERVEEFRKISSMYDEVYSNREPLKKSLPCPTKASVERYWKLVSASEQVSIRTLQTKEALARYVKLACTRAPDTLLAGVDDQLDMWIHFPVPTAVVEFYRDEDAGVYRQLYRTKDTVDERVLGSIAAIEESWRLWIEDVQKGNKDIENEEVPFFWAGVVGAALMDTTIKQYILVPDGIYFNVNPALLPLESTGQIRVDVVVDLGAYLQPEVPTNRIGSVMLVGGLDYGGVEGQRFALADRLRSDTGLDRGRGWVNLPGTGKEVNAIAEKLLEKNVAVDMVTGSNATAARFTELAFPQAIHLATHGFVDQSGPKERSAGLVLSGANAVGVDQDNGVGYLYAEDIRNLDLFACDLVVLSACRTALSSDGYGQGDIIKAFKDAGASKVIASSWAVPDECTSLLMEHFYDYYLAGIPASQALSEAQRKVALRFPNKRDWAAFMVYH